MQQYVTSQPAPFPVLPHSSTSYTIPNGFFFTFVGSHYLVGASTAKLQGNANLYGKGYNTATHFDIPLDPIQQSKSPGTTTVATNKFVLFARRYTFTSSQRLRLVGTSIVFGL